MTTFIVLTVIGKDPPGIFASLSEVLATHDGNWTESSVSTLAGQFAGILLATVPSGNAVAADRKYKAHFLGNWKVRPPEKPPSTNPTPDRFESFRQRMAYGSSSCCP